MSIYREDVGSECNTARRKFWELCASRQPQCIFTEIGDSGTHYFTVEDSNSIAQWADSMLAEWDKRWIDGPEVHVPSEEALAFLEEIKRFAARPDSETRNPNNEFHRTLYPQDAKLLLEAVGLALESEESTNE